MQNITLTRATFVEGKLLHKGTKLTIMEEYEGAGTGNYADDVFDNADAYLKKADDEACPKCGNNPCSCAKKAEDENPEVKQAIDDEIEMSLFPLS